MTREKFIQMAEAHKDMVYRLAFSYTKNPAYAEDITQNVLLALFTTSKEFDSDEHIKNWLVRTTINECKQLWRSAWNKTVSIDAYCRQLSFDDPHYEDLFLAIMKLDKKYRIVIALFYYEGYSIHEIAEILKIPDATVGTRLRRARLLLKKWLKEDDENDK